MALAGAQVHGGEDRQNSWNERVAEGQAVGMAEAPKCPTPLGGICWCRGRLRLWAADLEAAHYAAGQRGVPGCRGGASNRGFRFNHSHSYNPQCSGSGFYSNKAVADASYADAYTLSPAVKAIVSAGVTKICT